MSAELEVIVDAELVPTDDHAPATAAVDINDTLTAEASEDLANGGRENTRATYQTQWDQFAQWCAARSRHPGLPTTPKNLASYISHLRRRNAPPNSLRLAIAAVQHMNARGGYPKTPDTAEAQSIYQDHRHTWAAAGRGQRSSAPVDMQRLRQMLNACDSGTLAGQRDQTLLLLGYYMRARASELANLRIGDLEFVSADLVVATKRVSKNDKNDEGREYEIDDPACIQALRGWLAVLHEQGQGDRQMPLLRTVDRWGNLGPVGIKGGWGLTRQAVNAIVKSVAAVAQVDVAAEITAHGLRAGVPTDLGAAGYSAAEIKDITGDWASTEMVEKYRKVGLRRAGKRADTGRRAAALSMLRVTAPDTTTED